MTFSAWQIEFTQPLWFTLLAALPLLAVYWKRSLVNARAVRRITSFLLRSLLLLLVAAGLAGPRATAPDKFNCLTTKVTTTPAVIPPTLVTLTAPDHVRAGEPYSLDLSVKSHSADTVRLELSRDGQPMLEETMQLAGGDNHKIIPAIALMPADIVYMVRVKSAQYDRDDAGTAGCAVRIGRPPRVLVVESPVVLAGPLKKALEGENVAVDVEPELPSGPESFAQYDLIILSNVPASALPEARLKALRAYVHNDRGGMIVVGGDQSFTVGGYRHTALEEMLPVISEAQRDHPKRTLAMVLVVDISGSMNDTIAGNAKVRNIDLAKEALRSAVEQLGPKDQVGVLVFEDRSRWIWPLAAATDKRKIIDKINTIQAEGSTNMYPPLEQAYLALRESFADLKHIIVMTDGLGEPGDFNGLAEKIAAAGITMTTVGVGDEPAHGFLKSIADKAKGRSVFFSDASKAPDFFKNETRVAAKTGITEEPFFPQVVHATQALRGLDLTHAPALLGYVETQARPESQVVLASKTGEPILAEWRYGGGDVATFTSDIQSRWAAPWLKWPSFGKFWAQLVRQTMRRELPNTLRLVADASDGRLHFMLDATDRAGRFIDNAAASVAAAGSDGRISTTNLTQTAPGRYEGSLAAGLGTFWLEGEVSSKGKLIDSVQGGTVVVRMPETTAKVEGSIQPVEKTASRSVFLWPWLLGAALFVLVLDLAVRRTGGGAC
jgi:Ca-activated chloride channel homolog